MYGLNRPTSEDGVAVTVEGRETLHSNQGSLPPLVLIPAYNEAATVGDVVRRVCEAGFPTLVVDDGSTDATATRAARAGASVIRMPVNLGVGAALRCGYRWAVARGFTVVVQVDGDGQHRPESVASLVEALDSLDADLVIGSRFVDGGSGPAVGIARRVAMRVLARSASRAAGSPITDATSGFRAVRGELLVAFADSYPREYLGDTVEALVRAGRAGYVVREVPAHMDRRAGGTASAAGVRASLLLVRALLAVWLRVGHPLPAPDRGAVVGSGAS